jgi:3-deoxy-7-phosphoheptulonate synthase
MLEAKLASKQNADHKTVIELGENCSVGGKALMIMGGPCTVEGPEMMEEVATALANAPVQAIRGGVYKPRTSPYAFQGMGIEGLKILADIRERHRVPVITEVMSIEQIPHVVAHADILQVATCRTSNCSKRSAAPANRSC